MEWLTLILPSELKILHPDFSTQSVSRINVLMGCLVLFLLLVRWTLCYCYRGELLRHSTQQLQTLHFYASFIIWLFSIQETSANILDIGLNFALYLCHTALMEKLEEKIHLQAQNALYREVMNDVTVLYGVYESDCREIISDPTILKAFLIAVSTDLTYNKINTTEDRREQGKLLFETLLGLERTHRELLKSPHSHELLTHWLNK